MLVWDHALYKLDYYPDKFKNEDGLINLDSPRFWKWLKDDYRAMLDSLPKLDGIILTFIETGAHVEDQYSENWKTESEKLAHMVDSLASVIIDERGLELYIRTFIYYKEELDALLGCVNLVKHPWVKIMTKEVPHDFFLTHPISDFISKFNKEVIIEFDLGHEKNGQGVIASILPEITVERWKYYAQRNNVIGYVARTDRYGTTQNLGRPTEVNIYALKRIAEDTSLNANTIVKEFISKEYGEQSVEILKPVFLETDEIIKSTIYTLGLHVAWHSTMEFDHTRNYALTCSGRWLDDPSVYVKHGINKEFHYWKDVVEHLAPARHKMKKKENGKRTQLYTSAHWVIDSNWVTPHDKMNSLYLNYIITEKEYGVEKAKWAMEEIKKAQSLIKDQSKYEQLLHLYERTYITSQLYLAASKAYFGYRTFLNDSTNNQVKTITKEGLDNIIQVTNQIKNYPNKGPVGSHYWLRDYKYALDLYKKITTGWDMYDNKKLNYK